MGETRRAAAWTAAAVRVAREAVDRGLELRERAADEAARTAQWALEGRDANGDPLPEVERAAARATAERAQDAATPGARGAAGVTGGAPRSDGPGGAAVGGTAPRLEVPRNPVLVAGVLPFLGEAAETEAGRLAPRDAGVERDLRTAAGLLAEAGADLILVEGGPVVAGARGAADAAVETGLTVWVSVPVAGAAEPMLAGGEAIEAWAAAMIHAGVAGFLLVPAPGCDVAAALERLRSVGVAAEMTGVLPMAIGPSVRLETAAVRWMEAGAWHVGLGDGATPERLAQLRAAIDAVDGARLAERAAARDRWATLVGEAARRAPGGRAAWLGPRGAEVPLPAGFAWSELPADAATAMPAGELRLVIAAVPLPGERLAALLEPGGILLARGADPASIAATGLRLLDVTPSPASVLARRDP